MPCARLGWPSRQLLSARLIYRIVSYRAIRDNVWRVLQLPSSIPCGILHKISVEFHGVALKFHGVFHMESHGVSMENFTFFLWNSMGIKPWQLFCRIVIATHRTCFRFFLTLIFQKAVKWDVWDVVEFLLGLLFLLHIYCWVCQWKIMKIDDVADLPP